MIFALPFIALLTALPAIAEETKATAKITYLLCTEIVPKDADGTTPRAPDVEPLAFNETEVFAERMAAGSGSVGPITITWKTAAFTHSLSRVTGRMVVTMDQQARTTPDDGPWTNVFDCVVVDKPKF